MSTTHGYDIADRLQPTGADTGLTYDGFGRITTLPSADTGHNAGAATSSYYSNDLVRSQTQAGATVTYTALCAGLQAVAWAVRSGERISRAGGAWQGVKRTGRANLADGIFTAASFPEHRERVGLEVRRVDGAA